jgi:hypothetical protein
VLEYRLLDEKLVDSLGSRVRFNDWLVDKFELSDIRKLSESRIDRLSDRVRGKLEDRL